MISDYDFEKSSPIFFQLYKGKDNWTDVYTLPSALSTSYIMHCSQ